MLAYALFHADELVEPLAVDRAVAGFIGIHSMIVAGSASVHRHAEADRLAVRGRAEHQMQVPRLEAVKNPPAGLIERSLFGTHGPFARQAPSVACFGVGLVIRCPVADEAGNADRACGLAIADIGLGREFDLAITLLDAAGGDLADAVEPEPRGCLFQQALDHPLRLRIAAFAEMMMPNAALGIDEVVRRPVSVVERAPDA